MKSRAPNRLSYKYRIILLIIGLTTVTSGLNFYIIQAYQAPQNKYDALFNNITKANTLLLITQQIVDKDFYTTISNLNDQIQQDRFFEKIQSLKADVTSLSAGVIAEEEEISLKTIASMIDSFVTKCVNAQKKTTSMKKKLANYEQANTIYTFLSKNLTEFISLQIKNRQDVALELKRTTKRLRVISFVTVGIILSGCLIIGLFYAKRISEAIYAELSERKYAEQQAHHLAHHDQLTNLPNRRLFEMFLRDLLSSGGEMKLALLFIDLDGFKAINDTFGHNYGDEILKHVAAILQKHIRKEDLVARLGGDEFTVLLVDTDKNTARSICRRLIAEFDKPILVEEEQLKVTASIGISTYPGTTTQYQELIDYADTAMYAAKRQGKNQFVFS